MKSNPCFCFQVEVPQRSVVPFVQSIFLLSVLPHSRIFIFSPDAHSAAPNTCTHIPGAAGRLTRWTPSGRCTPLDTPGHPLDTPARPDKKKRCEPPPSQRAVTEGNHRAPSPPYVGLHSFDADFRGCNTNSPHPQALFPEQKSGCKNLSATSPWARFGRSRPKGCFTTPEGGGAG